MSREDIEREASSRSINKTIGEITRLSRGERIGSDGRLREKLHDVLFRLLRQKARFWYQRGFRRGHEAAREKSKYVPSKLVRPMRMRAAFLPKEGERIVLKSALDRRR